MALSILHVAQWISMGSGSVAALAALYGRHWTLPAFLTGPAICQLEAGGCQVLFRMPEAALLGVPNAALGLVMYAAIAVGLVVNAGAVWLVAGATLGLAMSIYLAWYLVRNRLECRICWVGHAANLVLWASSLTVFLLSPRS